MRALTLIAVPLLLTACAPKVPASNPGPGFSDYSTYQQQQLARQQGAVGVTGDPMPITTQPVGTPVQTQVAGASQPATAPIASNSGISDEQSFAAVTARETIETDAARRAAQAAAYQVVQPTQLPSRSGDSGPNIVQFALQTTNAVGQAIYPRGYTRPARHQRACAAYASDDAAQRAFLAGGGPQKNFQGLDPDGDGFACGWNPAPFRAAAASVPQAAVPVQQLPLAQ